MQDRLRSQNDEVSLKAELEIRHLHEKLDHLMSRQWQRLTEITANSARHAPGSVTRATATLRGRDQIANGVRRRPRQHPV
jgi:uncharacterized membrane protein